MKTYTECLKHSNYGDRLQYLRLDGIHHSSPRDISNVFYKSKEWLRVRKEIIARDLGCDLGIAGMYIDGPIIVHHINPITQEDIDEWNVEKLFNPDNLICVSVETHNLIHYRKRKSLEFVERKPGDTKLW